jgi:predicted dehydrogenase
VSETYLAGLDHGTPRHGFGIVGAGVIAPTHARAIAALPAAQLVAVTDVVPESAKAFAEKYGGGVEPDLDALLARADIDIVSVCVPSGLHAEVGVRAAAAGKHLVVEKPIDVTLAAADRLIHAVGAAGVVMTVISQHRFDPGLVELRRLLDEGTLGRLVFGEASTKWYRTQGYYDSAAWRGTRDLDGGALMNQGIHYVDLLRWCMGPLAEVTAVCTTQTHQMEAEDIALAVLRFSSGAVGTIAASTAIFPGFAQRLEISGTDGTVVVENGEIIHRAVSAELPESGDRGSQVGTGAAVPAVAANPADLGIASHVAQIADLMAAIDEGRQPLVTAESGRQALEVVCAVYESAREGRPIVLSGTRGEAQDAAMR